MNGDTDRTYLRALRAHAARVAPDTLRQQQIARLAGIDPAFVGGETPIARWDAIIEEARKRDAMTPLIAALSAHAFDDPYITALYAGRIPATAPDNDIQWRNNNEAITGAAPTFLPLTWLEQGLLAAQSVVRISSGRTWGTGFIVRAEGRTWIVTAHHVLPDHGTTQNARIEFGANGPMLAAGTPFALHPLGRFALHVVWNKEDDITAVMLDGPLTNVPAVRAATHPVVGTYVHLIHHPGGKDKQLSLHHNTVAYADELMVQYLADSLPGSSGAPVFDNDWSVVAIHRRGGELAQPGLNGTWLRNEGAAIQRLNAMLFGQMPPTERIEGAETE